MDPEHVWEDSLRIKCDKCGEWSDTDKWKTVQQLQAEVERLLAEVEQLQAKYDACHAELVAIDKISMCVAECPPVQDTDTWAVRGVKGIVGLVQLTQRQLVEQRAEVERLTKESAYYRNAVLQRGPLPAIPEFVPARVRLNRTVCGDMPFSSTYVEPGEYYCLSNRHGAVSVVASNGNALGLRIDEFEPIAWRANDETEAVRP